MKSMLVNQDQIASGASINIASVKILIGGLTVKDDETPIELANDNAFPIMKSFLDATQEMRGCILHYGLMLNFYLA